MMAGKKCYCQAEHQNGADYPVLHQGENQDSCISENLVQFLIPHFGQRRVHHENQTDGNGNIGGTDLKGINHIPDTRVQPAAQNTCKHGCKNP